MGTAKGRRWGFILAIVVTIIGWAAIIALAAVVWQALTPRQPRPARVVACERSTPPWAIAERCR